MSERLSGTTVVLTRRPEDNATLAADLRMRGAHVVEVPCVHTEPLSDTRALAAAITDLGSDDVLLLTSRAGVDAVAPLGPECPVAVVGSATGSRARRAGLRVTFVASRPDAATLARELPLPAGRVVLARSDLASDEPVAILRARGAGVRDVVAYRTVAQVGDARALRDALARRRVVVVVASPSAVDALAAALDPSALRRATFVAIGPRTAERVRQRVGASALVAEDPSAIAEAIPIPEEAPA